MEFKIELKDIEQLSIENGRIITNKKGKKIEYIVNNDVIIEVNPYDENRIAEEKINKLLGGHEGVEKIKELFKTSSNIKFKPDGSLACNIESSEVEPPTKNTDVDRVKGIISLEKVGVLDEIAAKNRDKIAIELEKDKELEETAGDERTEKIKKLKEILAKLESEDKE